MTDVDDMIFNDFFRHEGGKWWLFFAFWAWVSVLLDDCCIDR